VEWRDLERLIHLVSRLRIIENVMMMCKCIPWGN